MNRRDLFVVEMCHNANPNGDLAADNMPRCDYETGYGRISDVSIKRKIRDAVYKLYGKKDGFELLIVGDDISIEAKAQEIIQSIGEKKLAELSQREKNLVIKKAVCEKYWDARVFGATISNFAKIGISDGQINGPVQVCWGESLEPITVDEPQMITRSNAATEKDLERGKNRDIGRKWITNAQYVYEVHLSDDGKTGLSENDYQALLEGVIRRWDLNMSASKAGMEVEQVIEFIHDSQYGSASMRDLRKAIVKTADDENAPRKHYTFSVKEDLLPKGVKVVIH